MPITNAAASPANGRRSFVIDLVGPPDPPFACLLCNHTADFLVTIAQAEPQPSSEYMSSQCSIDWHNFCEVRWHSAVCLPARRPHFTGGRQQWHSYHHHNGSIPAIMPGSWQPRHSSVCKAFPASSFSMAASSRRSGRSTPPSCRCTLSLRSSSSGSCSTTTWRSGRNGFRSSARRSGDLGRVHDRPSDHSGRSSRACRRSPSRWRRWSSSSSCSPRSPSSFSPVQCSAA